MELWDVYDENRRPLHRTHVRGVPMRRGEYHLVVFVWIFNSAGQTLLTKRSPEKKNYPNIWSPTGGAVQAGETSLQAIARELREETGIVAAEKEFELMMSLRISSRSYFSDIYTLKKDVPLSQIVLQEGETCDAKWVNRAEFEAMIAAGEIAPPDIERYRSMQERFDEVLF